MILTNNMMQIGGSVNDAIAATTRTTVLSTVLHKISPADDSVELVALSASQPDLTDYLDKLLDEIGRQSQKRSFKFESPTSEFRTCLAAYLGDKDLAKNPHSLLLAKRLLRQELETMQKYKNLNEITKGSFLQFLYEEDGNLCYLGVKVEHQTFLDEEDFIRRSGLADERRLYKACRVTFKDEAPEEVFVFDTNGVPAAYWWREFLELLVLRDDVENTKIASEAVMNVVGALKRKHPTDHTILRNAAVAGFKQNAVMNYGQFISQIFDSYEPTDPEASSAIKSMIEKLKELPTKKKFDTQFSIVPSAVPFRQTKFILSSEITLTLVEGISDLADKVWAERDDQGRDLVVIHSDQAKHFTLKKRR